MHSVYIIEFPNRISNGILPHTYIGSKSNCTFDGETLFDRYGKPYWGSCKSKEYKSLISSHEKKTIKILYTSDVYSEVLLEEKRHHIENDVVANPKFFNRGIATISTYSSPDYGTFRHVMTNKCVRLDKNHPMVLSGEYINANTGMTTYNNGAEEKQFFRNPGEGWIKGRLEENIRRGQENNFYGQRHSETAIEKLKTTIANNRIEFPEKYAEIDRKSAIRCKKTFTGRIHTEEHNRKIGDAHKGYMNVIHNETGQTKRITTEEYRDLDKTIWLNFYAKSRQNPNKQLLQCTHCGFESDEGNASFKRWHMENCRMSPTYTQPVYVPGKCDVCGKIIDMNNSFFVGHHFKNCTNGKWEPWLNKPSETSLYAYSKAQDIYEFMHDSNLTTCSAKKRTLMIYKKFDMNSDHKHYINMITTRILNSGYVPINDESWASKFIKKE